MNGERIKPCISFCERVEQRCPYLHPIMREQYGGQPVFICRDPNIPFVPEITPEIPYNDPGKCYDLCHLSENLAELITDSLSKYDYDKCPDRSQIAEEVRNDPYYCGSTDCSIVKSVSSLSSSSSSQHNHQLQQLEQSATSKTNVAADGKVPNLDSNDMDTLSVHQLSSELGQSSSSGSSDDNNVILANRTKGGDHHANEQNHQQAPETKVIFTHSDRKRIHVHKKKLEELREVLATYKNQAKTHRYHAEHSSIYHPSAATNSHQH